LVKREIQLARDRYTPRPADEKVDRRWRRREVALGWGGNSSNGDRQAPRGPESGVKGGQRDEVKKGSRWLKGRRYWIRGNGESTGKKEAVV